MYVRLSVHTFFKDASIHVNIRKHNNRELKQTMLILSVNHKSAVPLLRPLKFLGSKTCDRLMSWARL